MFARSWVFCKQTAEPKAKACSGEASRAGEHQRSDSSHWGLRHQVTHLTVIWTSEYSVRTRNYILRHTPFIQVKQDYGTIGRSVTWEQGAGSDQ